MKRIKEYRDQYSYSVTFSVDDAFYVAKCIELGIVQHMVDRKLKPSLRL